MFLIPEDNKAYPQSIIQPDLNLAQRKLWISTDSCANKIHKTCEISRKSILKQMDPLRKISFLLQMKPVPEDWKPARMKQPFGQGLAQFSFQEYRKPCAKQKYVRGHT